MTSSRARESKRQKRHRVSRVWPVRTQRYTWLLLQPKGRVTVLRSMQPISSCWGTEHKWWWFPYKVRREDKWKGLKNGNLGDQHKNRNVES